MYVYMYGMGQIVSPQNSYHLPPVAENVTLFGNTVMEDVIT